MSYEQLADRLATDEGEPRVAAFPDGSVDTYYAAFDGAGERIDDRETFGERIARGDRDSFPVERECREQGGQAVNMARQADALDAATTLYGHLEDPVFDDLPFETVSMGEPTRVSAFPFEDDDLLLVRQSATVEEWSLADLEAAAPSGDAVDALAADAVCCGNWASVDGLTAALEALAERGLAAGTFVLDPGRVSTRSREALVDLFEVLGRLDEATDVVYSVNRTELEYTADAIDGAAAAPGADGDADADDLERLSSVREAAGITAAVLHATDVAAAVTRNGEATVENLSVDDPRRRTGAGDRFGAGLAVARARDWEWETALAIGNCCASHYVSTGETGDREALRSFLARPTAG